MITVDTTSLNDSKDEIYSVDNGARGNVTCNGAELQNCVYVNVTKGIAIRTKRDLSNNIMVADGAIVHELVFGEFTFEPIGKD